MALGDGPNERAVFSDTQFHGSFVSLSHLKEDHIV